MHRVAISSTGLFTPPDVITNAELVASYNAYAALQNAQFADEIATGSRTALTDSSVEFIEKASGIKSRHVLYKKGILDPAIMQPVFERRSEEQMPEMVEMALAAAKEAIAQAGKTPDQIDLIICAASNIQRPYPALSIELQQQLGARYVLSASIDDVSLGGTTGTNWTFWTDADRDRYYHLQVQVFDLAEERTVFSQKYQTTALWSHRKSTNLDPDYFRFWETPYGQAAERILNAAAMDVEEAIRGAA